MLVALLNGIIIFLGVLLIIGFANWRALRRLGRYGAPARFPRVAVLVPARNEESNIRACIESLRLQDYVSLEILALDDHSTDHTGAILDAIAAEDVRVRLFQGKPLPPGWLGKHWACQQLAEAADAELILFTDADTVHHPQALQNAVAALLQESADLVTAIPRERMVSWGEKLIVPLLSWSILYFLPLVLAHRLQWPPLSATIGQFMLFRRTAYEAIGGHAAVRHHIADDLALGRRTLGRGFRWRLVDAGERVECRMYRTGREAFEGFSKNLFAAFDYKPWLFVPVWLWLGFVFLIPLPFAFTGNASAVAAVLLALLIWAIFCRRFHLPLALALLYPAVIAVGVLIAFRSLALTLTGRATWKGRTLPARPEWEERA